MEEEKERLAKQLEVHEGIRKFPYTDSVGKLTIAVGRNLTDRGLSPEEITFLLKNDIEEVYTLLDYHLPWWKDLSENRRLVLADMCFNMGINKLLEFTNTLKAIKEGRYLDAAVGMRNSKWAKQVGKRAETLEAMMVKG